LQVKGERQKMIMTFTIWPLMLPRAKRVSKAKNDP